MIKQDLKNEYLRELHKLLKVLIHRFHEKNFGEYNFVNDFLVQVFDMDYKSSDQDALDHAITTSRNFNDDISGLAGVYFYSLMLNKDFEVEYTFKLFIDDIHADLIYIGSKDALQLDEFYDEDFDLLTEEELEIMILNVKSQSTFGLIKAV